MVEDDVAVLIFNNLVKISLGVGSKLFFWKDRWINGLAAADIAPLLCLKVDQKVNNIRTVQQGLRNTVGRRMFLCFSVCRSTNSSIDCGMRLGTRGGMILFWMSFPSCGLRPVLIRLPPSFELYMREGHASRLQMGFRIAGHTLSAKFHVAAFLVQILNVRHKAKTLALG